MRALLLTASLAAGIPAHADAQQAARPAFVSATVTLDRPASGERGGMRVLPGGAFTATGVTLRELVAFAYQRHPFDRRDVTGGPAWADSDRFDVAAKAAAETVVDPAGGLRRTWGMVQTLLAERFELRVHARNDDRAVYVLTVARSDGQLGPRLRRTDADCSAAMKGPPAGLPPGQPPPCSIKTPPGRLFVNTACIATIASLISPHLDRVVVDRTGLGGRFDVELEAAEIKAPPGYEPGPSDRGLPPAAGPSIFVAVREQLGLKLEPQVAPVPVIVIEHAEKPAVERPR